MSVKKNILLFICFFLSTLLLYSQDDEKLVESSIKFFKKGEYDKAFERLDKVLDKSSNSKYWDIFVTMNHQIYLEKISKGTQEQNTIALNEFINQCRLASLRSRSVLASNFIRKNFVDYDPDTFVMASAKAIVNKGIEEMNNKNFEGAIQQFQKAHETSLNYYKANKLMGDCYMIQKKFENAIECYKRCITYAPKLIEPRKLIADAYIGLGNFVNAQEEVINGLMIYPDQTLFDLLYYIKNKNHRLFNQNWYPRRVSINSFMFNNEVVDIIPWETYRNAKNDVANFCTPQGIITDVNIAKTKYLEVYSWNKMLQYHKSPAPMFDFANRMMKAGYLDCFVLFSMFHYDLYPQFQDFISNAANKTKLRNYIDKILTTN
ncbi:MAG: hypothetical protein SNJ71_02385 [Bacteroidales bacterium]